MPGHVQTIIDALGAIERGDIDRLAISMPPRHGKSETITVRYPLYSLLTRPDENVLVTGYNERFARKFGRRTRNMAEAAGIVAEDKTASDEWVTKSGGMYLARGVGSPPTGTGCSRIIIDDPIRRREDAESKVYREKAWDWYSEDLYTRLEPRGAIVMVATRWHHDDVMRRAIDSEPSRWHVINLPAIDDSGAALWPDRFGIEDLERIRAVNPRMFEALYQGNPTPRTDGFFEVGRFEVVAPADVPPIVRVCRAWDMASTTNGDYTAGVKLGIDAVGRYWVLDVRRVRFEPDARNRLIRATAESDGRGCIVRGPIDPGAAGKESALGFTRLLAGFRVVTKPISGDKALRADPFAAQVNAGNVSIVRGPWNQDYIEELRQFDSGAHDDQVDASADAFAELARPKFSIVSSS